MKTISIFVASGYLLYVIVSLLYYGNLSLISFINITFFIGGFYFFSALTVFILSTGFFDVVSNSFRRAFSFGQPMDKEEADEMRSLSEAISVVKIKPMLIAGCIILTTMMIGLLVYYY